MFELALNCLDNDLIYSHIDSMGHCSKCLVQLMWVVCDHTYSSLGVMSKEVHGYNVCMKAAEYKTDSAVPGGSSSFMCCGSESPGVSSALKYSHVRTHVAHKASLLSHQVDLAVPAPLCLLD